MTRLTRNITREELVCQCGCGQDIADFELISIVQGTVNFFMNLYDADVAYLIIKSGNRCPQHNENEGGAKNSFHIYGKAMDFKIKIHGKYIPSHEIYAYLDGKYPLQYGIGKYYKGRVHFDVRPGKSYRRNWMV